MIEGEAQAGPGDNDSQAAESNHEETDDLTKAVKRASILFPGLLKSDDEYFRSFEDLRMYLFTQIKDLLRKNLTGEKERDRLMERKNARELCIRLGMNEESVDQKFRVLQIFEEETNMVGKTPILQSIEHCIDNLIFNNPFGVDTKGKIQEDYFQARWLHYVGVKLEPGKIQETIDKVYRILQGAGYEDCYNHGTTASALDRIYKDDGRLKPSSGELSKHDFGSGLYCFKGFPERALSMAMDRSWPEPKQLKEGRGVGFASRDNPGIILFRDGLADKDYPEDDKLKFHDVASMSIFDVNPRQHMRETLEANRPDMYQTFLEKKNSWTEEHMNWKEFVKVARFFEGVVPKNQDVFHGVLHHCDKTRATDECNEPVHDPDGWEQFCFRQVTDLSNRSLFIEFHIDWNDHRWFQATQKEDITEKVLEEQKEKVDEIISQHQHRGTCHIL